MHYTLVWLFKMLDCQQINHHTCIYLKHEITIYFPFKFFIFKIFLNYISALSLKKINIVSKQPRILSPLNRFLIPVKIAKIYSIQNTQNYSFLLIEFDTSTCYHVLRGCLWTCWSALANGMFIQFVNDLVQKQCLLATTKQSAFFRRICF